MTMRGDRRGRRSKEMTEVEKLKRDKEKDKDLGDQDGRVEGHGIHFLPGIQQKYMYTWDNSQ